MYEYFNNKIADNIQITSVFLESIGLMLTIIELFKPQTANRIEDFIDETGINAQVRFNKNVQLIGKSLWKVSFPPMFILWRLGLIGIIFFGCFLLDLNIIIQIVLIVPIIISIILSIDFILLIENFFTKFVFAILFIFFSPIIIIVFYFLSKVIEFLNRLTSKGGKDGKALGSIGLILSVVGIIGSLYQTLTIFINK
jgi:hypothetical protein